MNHRQHAELGKGFSEPNPFEALYLLPSAPQELVMEVYWHLVHQLQTAARENPSVRSRLDQLNTAYAAVVAPGVRARYAAHVDRSEETAEQTPGAGSRTAPWLRRRRKAPPRRSSTRRGPWEVLHLASSAPPDIAELVYSFWCLRLRSQGGDSAATALEQLQEAYEALRNREQDLPPDPSDLESEAHASAVEPPPVKTASSATVDLEPAADAYEVDEPDEENPSDVAISRAWRSLTPICAPFGRWARGELSAGWERLFILLKDRLADPFHEYRADAPVQENIHATGDIAGLACPPSVEERLAALAASVVKAPDPQLVESEVSIESFTEALVEGEKTHDVAAQPLTRVTLPLPSETLPQVQPFHITRPSEVLAHLIAETDFAPEVSAIGRGPLWIGTDPSCDLVLRGAETNGNRIVACVWAHNDRFMLHVMAAEPALLVNGQVLRWAVLEDGDRLQIGDDVFRFQRTAGSEKRG